jgi:hypothetical protein
LTTTSGSNQSLVFGLEQFLRQIQIINRYKIGIPSFLLLIRRYLLYAKILKLQLSDSRCQHFTHFRHVSRQLWPGASIYSRFRETRALSVRAIQGKARSPSDEGLLGSFYKGLFTALL